MFILMLSSLLCCGPEVPGTRGTLRGRSGWCHLGLTSIQRHWFRRVPRPTAKAPGASRFAASPAEREARPPVPRCQTVFSRRRQPEHEGARNSPQIGPQFRGKSGLPSQADGRLRLTRADFQHRDAVPGEKPGKPGNQTAVGRYTIRAAIQSGGWLVTCHLGHQAAEIFGADVGRVAQNKVEFGCSKPPPNRRTRTVRDPRGAAPRHCARPAPRPRPSSPRRRRMRRGTPIARQARDIRCRYQGPAPVAAACGWQTPRRPPRSAFPIRDAGSAWRARRQTPDSRTRGGRRSAPAVRAPRAA